MLGQGRGLADGLDVEPDDERVVGRGRELDVGLVDGTDASVDDLDADLFDRQLLERLAQRLGRTLARRP